MAKDTPIEWADHTFNPWLGCQKVSRGCDHCYAERLSDRFGLAEWGPEGERKRTAEDTWLEPLRWARRDLGRRQRVFCASLADVFDHKAPLDARDDLWSLIRATPSLDWLLLTKRPSNISGMLPPDWGYGYRNVWLGVSAEDQETFDRRWWDLVKVNAVVRFMSYEPMLGPLNIPGHNETPANWWRTDAVTPDWVIAGGESGPSARKCSPDWARRLKEQLAERGIPFFFKQWGTYGSNPIVQEQLLSVAAAKYEDPKTNGKGGALLDGELVREFPDSGIRDGVLQPGLGLEWSA